MPVVIDTRVSKPEFFCDVCGQDAAYLIRSIGSPIMDTKCFCGWAGKPLCRETGRGAVGGPRAPASSQVARNEVAPRPDKPASAQMDLF